MPTLLAGAAILVGGAIVFRIARREWQRVNANLEAQRSAPPERESAKRLERDPETGVYRPRED
jgi:hypothetical protein